MNRAMTFAGVLAAAALAAGCVRVPRRAAFPGVKQEVAERTGFTVEWDQGAPEDYAAAAAVRRLLGTELTPEVAVQVALLNNRRLQATYEQLGIAQAELVRAGLLRNPVFDGSYRYVRNNGHEIEFDVVDDFLHVLLMPMRKKLAEAELERTRLHVTAAAMDLALRVRTAMLTLQADRRALEFRRTVLEAAEAGHDMAGRLRDAGNVTRLEVLLQRAGREQARLDVSAAEAAVLEDREQLNALMGLWGEDTAWRIAPGPSEVPPEPPAAEALEQTAVENSLDLAMAWRDLEVAARRMGITRVTSVLPELEVGASAERGGDGTWGIGPALALPLPLFNQGQPARAEARAVLRRRWQQYTALAVEVRAAARAALARLRFARDQAIYYRDVVVPLRVEITHQTQLRYNGMFVGVFQLLEAKRMEVETRRLYIERLRDYWIARAELEQILAGRLVGASAVTVGAETGGVSMGPDAGGH